MMKSLLLLAVLVSTITVNACPNLSGSYNCIDTDSEGNVENTMMAIQQQGNSFTIVTEEGSETIVADGSVTNIEGLDMTASCVGDKLLFDGNGSLSMDDGSIWTITSKGVASKSGRVMTTETKGNASSGSISSDFTNTSVCTEI